MSDRGIHFSLTRITIEMTTAFSIGTGRGDSLVDSVCVVDANGLPAIPGTTLAGVLRHAVADLDPKGEATATAESERVRSLFGYQKSQAGAASRVEASFGQVHDRRDRPVPFRAALLDETDEVLALLTTGVRRDHVAIDARGTVDEHKKFDVELVPAGARFTFELRIEAPDEAASEAQARQSLDEDRDLLLGLLHSTRLRLGGRSRRGLGAFKIVRAQGHTFNLREEDDRKRYGRLPRDIATPVPDGILKRIKLQKLPKIQDGTWVKVEISLEAEDYWMFGGGVPTRLSQTDADRPEHTADLVPVNEPSIVWKSHKKRERGEVRSCFALIPGSAVKGALRHRFSFHARRLRGQFVDVGCALPDSNGKGAASAIDPLEELLFGVIKNRPNEDAETVGPGGGKPGRMFIPDVMLSDDQSARDGWLDHVSIDRFTGGALDQRLFSEAPLFGGGWLTQILIQQRSPQDATWKEVGRALGATLRDLCEGRLALGAAGNRGHGYFAGEITATDEVKSWLGVGA